VDPKFVPAAMHCALFGQLTASKMAPVGIELVGTQLVKSVVLNVVAFPTDLMPTATQLVPVEQDKEDRALTLGAVKTTHG
jgi:hypothetical protein